MVVTAPLQDVNAQEKDTVTLEVGVNFEEISYRWLKNGVEIRSTDRCQARCRQRTHTLSIRNVHFGDSADYTFAAGSARTSAKVYVEGEMVASLLVLTWLNHTGEPLRWRPLPRGRPGRERNTSAEAKAGLQQSKLHSKLLKTKHRCTHKLDSRVFRDSAHVDNIAIIKLC